MVAKYRFLLTNFLLMGWLQCGQQTYLLEPFLSSYAMHGAQQLCWLEHIIIGAYSLLSNSPMHRKHSCYTLFLIMFWISRFITVWSISSIFESIMLTNKK